MPGCGGGGVVATAGDNGPTQGRGGSVGTDSCGDWWKLESKNRALFQIQYSYFFKKANFYTCSF